MSNFRRLGIITPSTASDLTGYFPDEMKVRNVSNVNSGTLGIPYGGTGLSSTPTDGQLLIGSGSSYSLSTLTAGTNVTITTGSGTITIAATVSGSGGGTVTSVDVGDLSNILSISGGPITTSGSILIDLQNQTGNTVLSSPSNGTSGKPTFRSLVNADIPSTLTSKTLTSVIASGSFSGSYIGDGSSLINVTASGIQNFTNDVRAQFSGGVGIVINSGVISASNVPNSALQNSAITLNGQSVSLGGSLTTVAAGTNMTSSTSSGTVTVSLQDSISLTNVTASHITGTDAKFNYVDYNNTAYSGGSTPALVEGRLFYDQNNLSLTEITDQGTLVNLGKQLTLRVKNSTGATLSKGKIVRITGNNGNTPSVNTASWDNDSTSANTLAVVMADISDTQFGYVLLTGLLKGVNTNGMTSGQMLYLSSSGDYTNVTPSSQYHEVRIGQVIDPGNNGTMFVRIQNGYELNELHDVDAASPAFGDLLSWTSNGGNNQWRNTKQLTGSYGLTGSLSATGQISGSTLVGNGAGITSITASNITNFTSDVRGQLSAGSNLAYSSGQFSLSANPSVTTITASSGFFTGDVTINGTASIGLLNTITQNSLAIGDKYIIILSGGVDHTTLDGSGIQWGSGSTGPTVDDLGSNAHIRYASSNDSLKVYPRLSGSLTGSFSGDGANISSITASNISNFTTDVRSKFTAGTNITIVDGVISSTGGGGSSGVTAITSSNSNLTFSPISGSVTGSLSDNLSVTSVTASSGFSGNLTGVATTARYGISQFTVASTSGLATGNLVCMSGGLNSPLGLGSKTVDTSSNIVGIIDAINGSVVDVMWAGERLVNESLSALAIGTPLYAGNSGAVVAYSSISSGEYATKVGYVSVSGSGAGTGKMFIQIHPFGQIN